MIPINYVFMPLIVDISVTEVKVLDVPRHYQNSYTQVPTPLCVSFLKSNLRKLAMRE